MLMDVCGLHCNMSGLAKCFGVVHASALGTSSLSVSHFSPESCWSKMLKSVVVRPGPALGIRHVPAYCCACCTVLAAHC